MNSFLTINYLSCSYIGDVPVSRNGISEYIGIIYLVMVRVWTVIYLRNLFTCYGTTFVFEKRLWRKDLHKKFLVNSYESLRLRTVNSLFYRIGETWSDKEKDIIRKDNCTPFWLKIVTRTLFHPPVIDKHLKQSICVMDVNSFIPGYWNWIFNNKYFLLNIVKKYSYFLRIVNNNCFLLLPRNTVKNFTSLSSSLRRILNDEFLFTSTTTYIREKEFVYVLNQS